MHQCTNAIKLVHSCIGAFLHWAFNTSGLSTLNEDQIAERGARLARRDDQEYREYLREEQRSQTGCRAREVVLDQRGQATSIAAGCHCLVKPWRVAARLSSQIGDRTVEASGHSGG